MPSLYSKLRTSRMAFCFSVAGSFRQGVSFRVSTRLLVSMFFASLSAIPGAFLSKHSGNLWKIRGFRKIVAFFSVTP